MRITLIFLLLGLPPALFGMCPPNYSSTQVQTGSCTENTDITFLNLFFDRLLTINGEMIINGNFTIWDDVTVNGTLDVTGNVQVAAGATLTVNGIMTVGGDFNNGGFFTGDTAVEGALLVSGNFQNNGTGSISGEGTLSAGSFTDNGGANNLSGDSDCSDGCCGSGCILPVVWVSFAGHALPGACELVWETAEELNNQGFYVEKSTTGESETFQTLAFVEGRSASSELLQYRYTDRSFNTEAYYRLKQVDFDGSSNFSKVIYVQGAATTELQKPMLFPNPTAGEVHFSGGGNARYTVLLHGLNGDLLAAVESIALNEAALKISERLHNLDEGTYVVSLISELEKHYFRILKQ